MRNILPFRLGAPDDAPGRLNSRFFPCACAGPRAMSFSHETIPLRVFPSLVSASDLVVRPIFYPTLTHSSPQTAVPVLTVGNRTFASNDIRPTNFTNRLDHGLTYSIILHGPRWL